MNNTTEQLSSAAKLSWTAPAVTILVADVTEAKVSSPGENGIVTGPS